MFFGAHQILITHSHLTVTELSFTFLDIDFIHNTLSTPPNVKSDALAKINIFVFVNLCASSLIRGLHKFCRCQCVTQVWYYRATEKE